MKVVKVIFSHWTSGNELTAQGKLLHSHPQSERIVIIKEDGTHEDILKNTIIKMEEIN
jgi:hypothetical protein